MIQSKIKPYRIYLGSAVDLKRRKRQHFSMMRFDNHFNKKLQSHYNKYGKKDLVFLILMCCGKDDLIVNEQFYIDTYKPWFNNRMIAESNFGLKMTEEIREKIRLKNFGNKNASGKRSEESKQNMRKPRSEEAKINMAPYFFKIGQTSWNKDKKLPRHSVEYKKKQSEGIRISWLYREKRYPTEETRQKQREIAIKNGNKPPSRKGIKDSENTRRKKSIAQTLRQLKNQHNEHGR